METTLENRKTLITAPLKNLFCVLNNVTIIYKSVNKLQFQTDTQKKPCLCNDES